MEFDNNIPIYQQIVDVMKNRIVSGELKSGDRIKSVRELAQEMGVNPNTMQKALALLEQEKLLITERTSGKFITHDAEEIRKTRDGMIYKMISDFFLAMEKLGVGKAEALAGMKKYMEGDGAFE